MSEQEIKEPFKTFPACNWEEDYEHENGNYINICIECSMPFKGHKRRVVCKMCAGPNWEELAAKQAPPDNKCAHAGCWGEGEMVGFARCMVKRVKPLEKQLIDQDKIATNRTVEEAISVIRSFDKLYTWLGPGEFELASEGVIKELEKLRRV